MSIASLYPSINPSLLLDFANSKVLDPRITFTRTTTATYYDGVTTAKAEENLLLQSQFASNWTTNAATSTLNSTTAPDGTTTATTLTVSTATSISGLYQNSGITSSGITLSIYAKVGTSNFVGVSPDSNGAAVYANFNLNTGAVASSAGCTASIVSVGSGWYRCILANTTVAGNGIVVIAPKNADPGGNPWGNGTPSVGNSVYIWGAQLEQRSSATAYTATTTQAITNYIPVLQTASAGQARFDHNPTTGESLGLLIEEARTNACLQSEDFNTGWTLANSTVSTNATIAPNGTLTADKITPSSTGSYRGLYRTFTASGATTVSVYAKYGGYQWFFLAKPDGSNIGVSFDILNGVKGTEQSGVTGTITSVGNGWYRCTCTQTLTGTAYVQIDLASADNTNSVTVAANDVFSGVFLWGAQAETSGSSFATSYIPTTGSTATRNADAASMTGTNFSSWFNGGAGTVFTESLPISATGSSRVCAFSDGSSSNRILIIASTGNHLYVDAFGSNVADLDGGTYSSSVFNKQGSGYAVNDYAVTINGGAIASDSSGATPVGINVLYIGADSNGTSNILNGRIRKLAYYPIRVTNTQLQSLTV